MNCRQARIDLALCVGEDLPDAARRESLRQHVMRCPGCRAHYKRLRGALRLLESSDRNPTYDVSDSLWPELSSRIRHLEETPGPPSRFNGWLPFVAVTAACAMLVVVMDVRPPAQSAPTIARDIFGVPSLFSGAEQSPNGQTFLPVGLKRWAPETYAIERAEPPVEEQTPHEDVSAPIDPTHRNH